MPAAGRESASCLSFYKYEALSISYPWANVLAYTTQVLEVSF